MKELDILLEAFLERERQALEEGAWPDLEDLLQTEDDLLWDWMQGHALPDSAEYLQVLDVIRQ